MYRTLKYQFARDEPKNSIPDFKKFNEYFTLIWKFLLCKVPDYDSPTKVPNFEKTLVLNYSDKNEVTKILNRIKKQKKCWSRWIRQ